MNCAYLHSTKILVPWLDSRCMYVEINFSINESCRLRKKKNKYWLISYRAGAWHYRIFLDFLKSPVSKWRIVGVKTRTKAFFFEEILINIPSENLSKLSKERMQYFCHALKLNLRSGHSASASNRLMNRPLKPNMIINFLQQRILCLILPAYEK